MKRLLSLLLVDDDEVDAAATSCIGIGLEFYVSTEICKCNGKIFCNNSILMNYVFAIFEIIFEKKITKKKLFCINFKIKQSVAINAK